MPNPPSTDSSVRPGCANGLPVHRVDFRRAPGQPYYIMAPDYRDTSSGITTLHHLCHILNLSGLDAYMAGCSVVSPDLKTPLLTDEVRARHVQRGLEPIAVYPEVAEGNPLGCAVVVRYFLNREMALTGRQMGANESDIRIHYVPWCQGDNRYSDGILTFPILDAGVFALPDPGAPREGSYVYQNRFPLDQIDFDILPDDVELLSTHRPRSLPALANLFKRAEVLYSYEWSLTCVAAMLSGCPVVFLPGCGVTAELFDHFYAGQNGSCMIDEPGGLDRARATLPAVRTRYAEIEHAFWPQLDDFITLTQRRATLRRSLVRINGNADYSYQRWLEERTPTASRQALLNALVQANAPRSDVYLVVVGSGSTSGVQSTLRSLDAQYLLPRRIWWLTGDTLIRRSTIPDGVPVVSGPWTTALDTLDLPVDGTVLIVHAGDTLLPACTLTLATTHLTDPAAAYYFDEDAATAEGGDRPMLKPDANIDLLRSLPYLGRTLAFDLSTWKDFLPLASGADALPLIDRAWQAIERGGPAALGHVAEVLVRADHALLDWAQSAEVSMLAAETVRRHLARMGADAKVEPGLAAGVHHVHHVHATQPLVSIIIPTRDQKPLLARCIDSLIEKTRYPHYEILVIDQASRSPEAQAYLRTLGELGLRQLRVITTDQAFNYAALNNMAARQARGDVLLFLNNDTQIIRDDWVEQLLSQALRPEVGVVGPRLDLPDGRVQHGGIVLGMGDTAGAAFQGVADTQAGYMKALQTTRNVSAISAACLMIRRDVFDTLGGFDEQEFPVYFGDVDLALKARQAGYLAVWTPATRVMHEGGATRLLTDQFGVEPQPDIAQIDRLYAKWLPALTHDPATHHAFARHAPGYALSPNTARCHTPLPGKPLPVILASHGDWHGCGHYRVIQPFQALAGELLAEGGLRSGLHYVTEANRYQPDVMVLQGNIGGKIPEVIQRYKRFCHTRVVLEFDDYLPNLPIAHPMRGTLSKTFLAELRRTIEQADWLVVSTPALADAYSAYHPDIRVALNTLDPAWWGGLSASRRGGRKPRVGWAGGGTHRGDLSVLRAVVHELADEVEWVFMGMKPERVACEFHPGVPINQYPAAMAALDLDLAVVPLEDNAFNTCKSNLRLLELGACGVPIICSDVEPYRGALPVTRVRNRHVEWVDAIRSHVAEPTALAARGDAMQAAVRRDWMLKDANLLQWRDAWTPKATG